MRLLKKIYRFYNNCIEIPRQDFTNKFPNLEWAFDYLYLLVAFLNLILFSNITYSIHWVLGELFSWFVAPILLLFFGKLVVNSVKDFFKQQGIKMNSLTSFLEKDEKKK